MGWPLVLLRPTPRRFENRRGGQPRFRLSKTKALSILIVLLFILGTVLPVLTGLARAAVGHLLFAVPAILTELVPATSALGTVFHDDHLTDTSMPYQLSSLFIRQKILKKYTQMSSLVL